MSAREDFDYVGFIKGAIHLPILIISMPARWTTTEHLGLFMMPHFRPSNGKYRLYENDGTSPPLLTPRPQYTQQWLLEPTFLPILRHQPPVTRRVLRPHGSSVTYWTPFRRILLSLYAAGRKVSLRADISTSTAIITVTPSYTTSAAAPARLTERFRW